MFLRACALCALVAVSLPAQTPDKAADLLESRKLEEIRIQTAPEDWQTLKDNYLLNDYYRADFYWNGQTVSNVGIRSRGRGSRSPIKPGLRVDFKRYQKQDFLGLTALVLINMTQDPPMLREYLSMALFRAMGAPAPREAFARVYLNDEYLGLYLAVEDPGKPYLRRAFGTDAGDLFEYKCPYPWFWNYLGDTEDLYVPTLFEAQTHEDSPDIQSLIALVRALDLSDPDGMTSNLGPHLDFASLLRHVAVENYLGDTDGFVGEVGTNNFYLYRLKAGTPYLFIPWDKGSALLCYWCSPFHNFETSVLLSKAMANPDLKAQYLDLVRKLADTAGAADGWLASEAEYWIPLIRDAALEDTNKPYSNEQFESSQEDVRFFLANRSPELLRQLETRRP